MFKESKFRSVIKSVSWRFCATLTTVTLVLIFTGEADIAFTVGGLEIILKMLIYFFHERGWDKIKWGKQEIQPCVVWITGLSGSGKTTIAREVVEKLREKGLKVDHLDGETVRNIFPETGFTRSEVNEHIKRVGYLASRLENNGIFVVASFLSPFKESREFVRGLCNNFVEIHLSTPIEICEKRDTKNLYSMARKGIIKNLPGIDVDYEESENTELLIDAGVLSVVDATDVVYDYLKRYF